MNILRCLQVIFGIIMYDEQASLLPYRRRNRFLRYCPRDYMRPLIMNYVMHCHFYPHIFRAIYNSKLKGAMNFLHLIKLQVVFRADFDCMF